MSDFESYLKNYLIYNNISQTEFADRLNITQKHMNEILNGKADITLEMAIAISRLTNISVEFIINSESRKLIINELIKKYKNEENINKVLKDDFHISELAKLQWIDFKDINNPIQNYMDLLSFLNVRNFEALDRIKEKTILIEKGEDLNKLNLWIARCDELSKKQKVNEYMSINFPFLIEDLRNGAYNDNIDIDNIQILLNNYGIYFVVEKALSGTKVSGCFKVKGKNPAIYVTKNYQSKDSFYFELFHELGHCKSDYNEAKSKIIVIGDKEQESKADIFAINTMISKDIWEQINLNLKEENLLNISLQNKIPMSFIVGRLAKENKIKYNSKLYNKYKLA